MKSRLATIAVQWILLLLAVVAHEAENDEVQAIYNNELFPRNSLYGKLQESLVAQEVDERQFAPINQNTGQGPFSLNPLVSFLNRLPLRRNPEFAGLINTYDSCKSPDGEMGLCMGAAMCTVKGGKASGSCNVASVCCVNVVSKCSGTLTMNNTYWQSPNQAVAPSSTCSVSLRLDQNLPEQKKVPVCQVRLDFIAFTIAQPAATSVCAMDTFQASGAQGSSPIICGDNNDQHMYLSFESSARKATDVQLTFTFGTATTPRSWNIRLTMIPCGATYAAPANCLQYFTGNSGTVKSFNWIDATATQRQLANQEYSICFRSELVGALRANAICFQVCSTTAAGAVPFRLTSDFAIEANANSVIDFNCQADYISIIGGAAVDGGGAQGDRFCGGRLNTGANPPAVPNTQICTTARQFRLYYRTNGDEINDNAATPSTGFCLNYMQRLQ